MQGVDADTLRDDYCADLGLDAEPWTMRSLSTLKAPGAELACMPAMAESISFRTTPYRMTLPLFTMM